MRREERKKPGRQETNHALPGVSDCARAAVVQAGASGTQAGGTLPARPGSPPPPVVLNGPGCPPAVLGKQKETLRVAQYNVVQALLDAGPAGLTKDELVRRSRHGDAVNIIKRLARSDADWAAVLPLPVTSGKGYRLAWAGSGPRP